MEKLRDVILSCKFDDSIKVKNNEHICKDGSIYDYSSLTNIHSIFACQITLTTVPLFNISNVVHSLSAFLNCISLLKKKQVEFFYQKL
jgi:hypothetical protein